MTELTPAQRHRFGWEARVRSADDLPAAARTLAVVLATFTDRRTGTAYPGVTRLARCVGSKPHDVRQRLKMLERAGWVTVVRRGGGRGHATVYGLTDPALFVAERGPDATPYPDGTGAAGDPFAAGTGAGRDRFPDERGPGRDPIPAQTGAGRDGFPAERGTAWGGPSEVLEREISPAASVDPTPMLPPVAGVAVDTLAELVRADPRWRPRVPSGDRRRMLRALESELVAGRSPSTLVQHCRSYTGPPIEFPAGLLTTHLEQLPPPEPEPAPPPPSGCDDCDRGFIELEDGRLARCRNGCRPRLEVAQ